MLFCIKKPASQLKEINPRIGILFHFEYQPGTLIFKKNNKI